MRKCIINKALFNKHYSAKIILFALFIVSFALFICHKTLYKSETATIQASNLNVGDSVKMGEISHSSIEWKVAYKDAQGRPLLVQVNYPNNIGQQTFMKIYDDVHEYTRNPAEASNYDRISYDREPYDLRSLLGSNRWATSTLRTWLNSNKEENETNYLHAYYRKASGPYNGEKGFLSYFTAEEQNAIALVNQPTAVNKQDYYLNGFYNDDATKSEFLGYNEVTDTQDISYQNAYYENVKDKVFLLSLLDLKKIYDNSATLGDDFWKGTNITTWIREPHIGTVTQARFINKNVEKIYATDVVNIYTYVRCAMYLNEDVLMEEIGSGIYKVSTSTAKSTSPAITTDEAIDNGMNDITLCANLTDKGGTDVIKKGFRVSTTRDFTTSQICYGTGTDTGYFEVNITDIATKLPSLTKGSTLYFQSLVEYIKDSTNYTEYGVKGKLKLGEIHIGTTSYGTENEESAHINSNDKKVILCGTIQSLSGVNTSNVEVGFEIATDENFTVGLTTHPYSGDIKIGRFFMTFNTDDFTNNINYYYRAYAIDKTDTPEIKYYGDLFAGNDRYSAGINESRSFQIGTPTLRNIASYEAISITSEKVTNIVDQPKGRLISYGVEYSKVAGFASDVTRVPYDGTLVDGKGEFTIQLDGLDPFTEYHYRPYAENDFGESYGVEKTFTTSMVKTLPAYEVKSTSVTLRNKIFPKRTDGGSPTVRLYQERGYEISKNSDMSEKVIYKIPVVNSEVDTMDEFFTMTITGLDEDTTYYYKAYAFYNYLGLLYHRYTEGEPVAFTTKKSVVMDWNISLFDSLNNSNFVKSYDGNDKAYFVDVNGTTGFSFQVSQIVGANCVPIIITGKLADSDVGNNKTITLTATSGNEGFIVTDDSATYNLTSEKGYKGEIVQKLLKFDINVLPKYYDDTDNLSITLLPHSEDIVSGETVNISIPTEKQVYWMYDDFSLERQAGNKGKIRIQKADILCDNSNYTFEENTFVNDIMILPRELNIDWAPVIATVQNKEYDGTDVVKFLQDSTLKSEYTMQVLEPVTNTNLNVKVSGTYTQSDASDDLLLLNLNAEIVEDALYRASNFKINNGTNNTVQKLINKKVLTYSANGVQRAYDGTNMVDVTLELDEAGIVPLENVSLNTNLVKGTITDINASETLKVASFSGISLVGIDANNYACNSSGIANVKIVPASLSDTNVIGIDASYEYTSGKITPTPIVKYNLKTGIDRALEEHTLVKDIDYTVTYGDNKNVGLDQGNVIIAGINNYYGTINKTFDISKHSIEMNWTGVDVTDLNKTYDGTDDLILSLGDVNPLEKEITVDGAKVIITGKYTDKNANDVANGKGITLTARLSDEDKDNYSLTGALNKSATGKISRKTITYDATCDTSRPYDGSKIVKVTLGNMVGKVSGDNVNFVSSVVDGQVDSPNADETNFKDITLALELFTGSDKDNYTYALNEVPKIKIMKADITGAEIDTISDYRYNNGSTITPTPTVKYLLKPLEGGTATLTSLTEGAANDYTYIYENNTSVKTDSYKPAVIITANESGNFTGSIKKEFNILKNNSITISMNSAEFTYDGTSTGKILTAHTSPAGLDSSIIYKYYDKPKTDASRIEINQTDIIDKATYYVEAFLPSDLYECAAVNAELKINPRPLKIKTSELTVSPKIYDGDLWADVITSETSLVGKDIEANGIVASDVGKVNLVEALWKYQTSNVGETRVVISPRNPGNIEYALTGGVTEDRSNNYSLDLWPTSLTGPAITPKEITYDIEAVSRPYDGTNKVKLSITNIQGVVTGDEVKALETDIYGDIDNVNAGTRDVTVTSDIALEGSAASNYYWTLRPLVASVEITKVPLKDTDISIPPSIAFTGSPIQPALMINNTLINETNDLSISYGTNTAVGSTGTVTINAKATGNFSGSIEKTFHITNKAFDMDWTLLDDTSFEKDYDGTNIVKFGENDFKIVNFSKVIDGDLVEMEIKVTGTYADINAENTKSLTLHAEIANESDLANYSLTSDTNTSLIGKINKKKLSYVVSANDKDYDGTKNITLNVTNVSGKVGTEDVSLIISGLVDSENADDTNSKNVNLTVTLSGADKDNYDYNTPPVVTAKIRRKQLVDGDISLSASSMSYTGSQLTPSITVNNALIKNDTSDIEVTYGTNINVGTEGRVTITCIDTGNFKGTLTKTFSIVNKSLTMDWSQIDALLTGLNITKTYDKNAKVIFIDGGTQKEELDISITDADAGMSIPIKVTGIYTGTNAVNAQDNKDVKLTAVVKEPHNTNYALDIPEKSYSDIGKIEPKEIEINIAGENKIYDGTTNATVRISPRNASDVYSGDIVTFTSEARFADKEVGNNKEINVTNITCTNANYKVKDGITTGTTTANITAKPSTPSGGGGSSGGGYGGSSSGGSSASSSSGGSTSKLGGEVIHKSYMSGYKDNTFRPNEYLSRAEIATMLARVDTKYSIYDSYIFYADKKYQDIDANHWAATYIGYLAKLDMMTGYSDNTFRPSNYVTRAELASALVRFKNIDIVSNTSTFKTSFNDIQGRWYEKYVKTLEQKDIVSGYADGTFRANTYVTRAEAVTMINRALGRIPDKEQIKKLGDKVNKFKDVESFRWYYADIIEATSDDIIKSKN